MPLIEHYQNQGTLFEIEGQGEIEAVTKTMLKVMNIG
jgi:adenylate kinase family enzyme